MFPQLSSHREPVSDNSLFKLYFNYVTGSSSSGLDPNFLTLQTIPPELDIPPPETGPPSSASPPDDEHNAVSPKANNESTLEAESSGGRNSVEELGKHGYVYVPFDETAPKNISSKIDPANIIAGGRYHMAMVLVGEPSSLKDPILYAQR
ncbi:hypothetical protein MJO28_001958 [Puccinia striiformis f. sp. tritici]|uniref:Uncharacterized protein n=3 Tax=Puccinia striiformis TaxID=27350 RepID=A0A0L0VEZ0_9BASI|nr:hypothetical protein MJO28_001958 [Puccinia striiformis f. sp. tritici]KAI7966291.1 hypothetical protein MJO29_002039 [Puccinia striiformis f. sp. tritici]KNE97833.1 hypothetical protein PSTG_08853 [Puccinia striiformis f. sp. tritici PST-78]POW14179.1 hypothetical protein PSTT_03196 [Puccinia striiformis]